MAGPQVDLALVLAIDASGSVDATRLDLQRDGYGRAVVHGEFVSAVRAGPRGRVALTVIEWSSADRQDQVVPWTLIDGAPAAARFARALAAAPSPTPGFTSISGGIDRAVRLLQTSGFRAGRRMIDVSGDGASNDGRSVTAARDAAVAAGVTINGLPLIEGEPALAAYYAANVIGGPGAFLVPAVGMGAFAAAILAKLVSEVAQAT